MKDLFEHIKTNKGNIGRWASHAEGYYVFPKLEGELGPHMKFQGKEILNWSINDYLGLANHPEIRKADAEAAAEYGAAYPMGARMMSGHTTMHEELEQRLAKFVQKEAAYLLNFGYQERYYRIRCRLSCLYYRWGTLAFWKAIHLPTQ